MKKILSYAIAGLALLSAFTAQAGDKFVVDGIQYEIMADGSGVQVIESTDRDGYTGNITIPATVKNGAVTYKVVGIGKNAFQWCEVGTVTMPNTVLVIDKYAFNASDVEKVVLSENLEIIKSGAFSVVKSLEDLSEIPASCTTIEPGAFMMTNSLKEFKINAQNPAYKTINGAIFTKSGKSLLAVPYGMVPAEFVIPEGTDSVLTNAFNTFQALEKITFPSTLKFLGISAFTYCNKMVNTNDLPESLEILSASAFSSCKKLGKYTLGPNVTLIGSMAFNNAVTPAEVHLGGKITGFGSSAFSSSRSVLTKVIFDEPEIVKAIPDFGFQNAQITELVIAEGYEVLGSRAFGNNTKLKKIDLPSTLKTIDNYCFENVSPDIIICRATTPPVYDNYDNPKYPFVTNDYFEITKVYVPAESVDKYKADSKWKDFTNILPLSELSGFNDVDVVKTVSSVVYYDMNGREIAPSVEKKGLYIVRTTYSDGSVKVTKRAF